MKLKIKFDIKPILNYIATILITALGITAVLIALPLTEKLSERTSFDLFVKDKYYWSSEYFLTLETTERKEIEKTRDILFKRLNHFGVEKISIRNLRQKEEGSTTLHVVVNSTQDKQLVKQLITNKFNIQLMTKKEEVDFFNPEDEYAYLFETNYNPTGWDRSNFRNVHITQLRTVDDTYSYFAIFKPWPNKQGDFLKLLEENKGQYIGINIDGFVTPYLVPLENQNIFAVPITSDDPLQVEAMSILYNSGIIPTNYSLESEKELSPQVISLDHIKISIGLMISFLLVYAYMLLFKKGELDIVKKSFLATVITISIYITVLKLFQIPIDTFLLPIIGILTALLIKITSANKDSIIYIETILVITLSLVILLSYGYMQPLATHLIGLIILSKLCLILSGWYLDKVKSI